MKEEDNFVLMSQCTVLLCGHGNITDHKNSSRGEFGIGCGVLLLFVRVIVSTRDAAVIVMVHATPPGFFMGRF